MKYIIYSYMAIDNMYYELLTPSSTYFMTILRPCQHMLCVLFGVTVHHKKYILKSMMLVNA
jgi:hypothetical protein